MTRKSGFTTGDWQVFPQEGKIVRVADGEVRRIRPKAMDVLCALADQQGQLVERDDLLARVWGRQAVSDEPLTSTIGELRRLLGERPGQQRRYIETLPKRGYRLIASAEPLAAETSSPAADSVGLVSPEPGAEAVQPVVASTDIDAEQASRRTPRVRLDWSALVALSLVVALIAFAVQRFSRPPASLVVPANSIAVLPFEDLSYSGESPATPGQISLSEGLAEELITLLSSVSGLRVAARQSSLSVSEVDDSVTSIGARLRVAHTLTGDVQQNGERVLIRASLIETHSGYQLWASSFDRNQRDIFSIQNEIVAAVRAQLNLTTSDDIVTARPTDLQAYVLYQQARYLGRQHTADSLRQAVRLYREALDIDPTYAPAWNDLAGVYLNQIGFALVPSEEGFRLASEAAYKALAIDDRYAPAHGRLGWIALHANSDFAAAARHYRRALKLEPGNDVIRSGAAPVALALGRLDIALELFEGSAIDDPVSPASHANLANALLLTGRYVKSEQSIRNALTLSPTYAGAQYRLGRALLAQGKLEAAAAAMDAEPIDAARWIGQALVANAREDFRASDAALERVLAAYGDAAAGNLAQVYAHRGDVERAFHWLDVELATSGVGGFAEYRWDPVFESIRSDARWLPLMQRVGLDASSTAAIEFP